MRSSVSNPRKNALKQIALSLRCMDLADYDNMGLDDKKIMSDTLQSIDTTIEKMLVAISVPVREEIPTRTDTHHRMELWVDIIADYTDMTANKAENEINSQDFVIIARKLKDLVSVLYGKSSIMGWRKRI